MIKYATIVFFAVNSGTAWANYQLAVRYAANRDYINAAPAYFQAYSTPKNAQERAYAEWGLAQALEKLGFYYSASKYYSLIVRKGPSEKNPYFSKAMQQLGTINSVAPLGQSHVVQLFKSKLDTIPGGASGFYFYYQGLESFTNKQYETAASYFKKVQSNSAYYFKALFHLGVVANLSGQHSKAISYFEAVRNGLSPSRSDGRSESDWMLEQTNLNIARVYYETKKFTKALEYYAQVPRESENWLEAIFESSWAFFLMQKHNNTLGNIHTLHSPFFDTRFFPESYIVRAITFLRLCRYDEVKKTLNIFKEKYKPVFQDVKKMLAQYNGNHRGFFKLIYDYRVGSLNQYRNAWAILDAVSRSDTYREAGNTIKNADAEIAKLSQAGKWQSIGLAEDARIFINKKKQAAIADASSKLYDKAMGFYDYLKELSDQTKFIVTEMALGKVDSLRSQLNVTQAEGKQVFIGGLQPLNLTQELEFWPFDGEYWEDELGYYVYNVDSKCNAKRGDAKSPSKSDNKSEP